MQLSIIIPTLNEEENIGRLIHRLRTCGSCDFIDIIVVDADSNDRTVELAESEGARVFQAEKKGRGPQMNQGASQAKGEILYFVHGDSLPPEDYYKDIESALKQNYRVGGFRFKFDSKRRILNFNSYMTRFNRLWVRGGDQTMFVCRKLFKELGGFREDYLIMEDYDFIERAQEVTPFKVIQNDVLVSARKYEEHSWLRVQIANSVVFTMYRMGFSQEKLVHTYKRILKLLDRY